jgi:hypothetical protein
MLQVQSPFQQFFGLGGDPLDDGSIYVGTTGQNPETNPIAVFWDGDGTLPAVQPLKTSNGYLVRSGTPARVYVNADDFSMTAKDKKGRVVFSITDVTSLTGANNVQFLQLGAGAVVRTAQDKMRDFLSSSDFATLAQMWAADTYKQKFDPITGKVWFNTDLTPLDYSTSRAGFVFQHRDTASGALNELIPGAVDQFNVTGNGVVNAGIELSQTIWQGRFMYMNKTGDGSAHSATVIGQLGAVGPGGYNELGGYQGEMTNVGSALGTMSGVEMLLKDSPDGGATNYSTKMQAIVGRIAKYNPTTRKSYHFYASSEGTLNTNGVIGVNPGGNKFERGFDFQDAAFSTGQFGLAPNNTSLAWMDSGGVARPTVGMSGTNFTYLRPGSNAATVDLQDFSGVTRFQLVSSSGLVAWVNQTLGVSATAGTNGAPPAQVAGYINVIVNGTQVKLPYYNV